MLQEAKVKTFTVAGTKYRGANPEFSPMYNKMGMLTGWYKVKKGVPFRKVEG